MAYSVGEDQNCFALYMHISFAKLRARAVLHLSISVDCSLRDAGKFGPLLTNGNIAGYWSKREKERETALARCRGTH